MLILDNITIIICAALLLIALLSIVNDSFLRRIFTDGTVCKDTKLPSVSVIVISDNGTNFLEKNLQAFLSQNYPSGFEVIVVVGKNEEDTDGILKRFGKHENLYATFVPDSSRYMSRRKLAITLGVKAAKNNLILVTDAECRPNTDKWILSMASKCVADNADIVVGYSNYDVATKPFWIFERLFRSYNFIREVANGKPYAMAGNNLMFKKSMFMDGKGFQGNLKYLRGEYEFIVNKYGEFHSVTIAVNPNSFVIEEKPAHRTFINSGVFYADTRRHLERGLCHRAIFDLDMLFLHLGVWIPVAAGVYSGLTNRWIALGVAVMTLIVPCITRTLTASRALTMFNAPLSKAWTIIKELRLVPHNISVLWKYKTADKTDFITHKS